MKKNWTEDDKNKEKKYYFHAISYFSQIGITIVVCVLIGVFLGKFLDNILGTTPWLLLVFSLMGAGAALKAMYDLGQNK